MEVNDGNGAKPGSSPGFFHFVEIARSNLVIYFLPLYSIYFAPVCCKC